ncbi:hypothetical protein IWQ48_003842 [Labrenzia sp. EL_13]|nr:hypothetical protein [Labrenzia sp. EL_13]
MFLEPGMAGDAKLVVAKVSATAASAVRSQ